MHKLIKLFYYCLDSANQAHVREMGDEWTLDGGGKSQLKTHLEYFTELCMLLVQIARLLQFALSENCFSQR